MFVMEVPAIREAHPGKHVSGDREREQGRPEIDMERVEPCRRRRHQSKRADPHGIEADDQDGAGGSPGEAHPPSHRVGKDGAEAQRQRVGPAARKGDLDGQR